MYPILAARKGTRMADEAVSPDDEAAARVRALSFWHDSYLGSWTPRPPAPGDLTVDVAVVGGGYSGLWTAYYLQQLDPSLRIAVFEAHVAGYGASGRNGGWCSAIFPATWKRVARDASPDDVRRLQRTLNATVDEVASVIKAESIECAFVKGGYLSVARNQAQLVRARREVDTAQAWGMGDDFLQLLSAEETRSRLQASGALGATFTPHCAALNPTGLVRGLAEAVERGGAPVYEQTVVTEVNGRRVRTNRGTVTAEVVVLATEGYTPNLQGHHRDLVPMYSLMVATEPLPDEVWATIGLASRETFSDKRHLRIYGQRTADGRLAFGGRGAPYHFRSRIDPRFDHDRRVHAMLREILKDLIPAAAGARFTHSWGGNLGIPRDWYPFVSYDASTGVARAGGYVGDGVATANLAGRTLAHLITGTKSDLTSLPWVGRSPRRWEPEPLRWLAVNAVTQLFAYADRSEARTGRPSRAASMFWRTIGH